MFSQKETAQTIDEGVTSVLKSFPSNFTLEIKMEETHASSHSPPSSSSSFTLHINHPLPLSVDLPESLQNYFAEEEEEEVEEEEEEEEDLFYDEEEQNELEKTKMIEAKKNDRRQQQQQESNDKTETKTNEIDITDKEKGAKKLKKTIKHFAIFVEEIGNDEDEHEDDEGEEKLNEKAFFLVSKKEIKLHPIFFTKRRYSIKEIFESTQTLGFIPKEDDAKQNEKGKKTKPKKPRSQFEKGQDEVGEKEEEEAAAASASIMNSTFSPFLFVTGTVGRKLSEFRSETNSYNLNSMEDAYRTHQTFFLSFASFFILSVTLFSSILVLFLEIMTILVQAAIIRFFFYFTRTKLNFKKIFAILLRFQIVLYLFSLFFDTNFVFLMRASITLYVHLNPEKDQ